MKHFRTILIIVFLVCSSYAYTQQNVSDLLINQGVWFLSSTDITEIADNEQINQTEYFKKDDVSSIFFEQGKVYTVYTKMGNDVMEDNWKIVDDTHFVMVGPDDGSAQLMEILELNSKKLVLKSCNDINEGITCTQFTYMSNKDNWPTDAEIDKLNKDIKKEDSISENN